jgi:hypothetical protein
MNLKAVQCEDCRHFVQHGEYILMFGGQKEAVGRCLKRWFAHALAKREVPWSLIDGGVTVAERALVQATTHRGDVNVCEKFEASTHT